MRQNKPLQKPITRLWMGNSKDGIWKLDTWAKVWSLLQITVRNSLILYEILCVYRRKPLWLLFDKDLAWLKLKCVVMKIGLVNMEFQDLETHLNRNIDFTGSRIRMSYTTSSGRCWDIIGGSALFVALFVLKNSKIGDCLGFKFLIWDYVGNAIYISMTYL